jgi:Holliday junction DNA helicase RuvA
MGLMISSLKGKITRVWGSYIELEVKDVGYLVMMGVNYLRKHSVGEEVKIQTYMAVSENDMALYGFETWEEMDFFKLLITVSGIGPKTAAQILGQANSIEVIKAIGEADVKYFEKIKGVGKKTAQRIIVDLKSKIGGLGELDLTEDTSMAEDEVTQSLKQLGFEKGEIEKVTAKMPKELVRLEEKLEWCLQNLG